MQKKTNPMLSETHPVVNKHSWLFKIGIGYLGLGFRCQIAGVYRGNQLAELGELKRRPIRC